MNPVLSFLRSCFRQGIQEQEQCSSLRERIRLLEQEREFHLMQAEYLASHDALTGLPNRNLFRQRIVECIETAREDHQSVALMFLDLDNFKMVNDTLGHIAGDALLVEATVRMRRLLAGEGFLARLGGDEFGLVLREGSVRRLFELAHALIDTIRSVYVLDDHTVSTISVSIGMAIFPDDGKDVSELLRHADAAMYESKRTGKNRVTRFHPDMQRSLMRRSHLEERLREAIRTGEGLSLALQPKVRLQDGHLTGFEALARWCIPGEGVVSPMEFIPLAEETGLIVPLTHFILREAISRVAELGCWGWPELNMAINISPRQFAHPELAPSLSQAVEDFRVSPGSIELEITESTLLDGPRVIERMQALSQQGFRLAIDDFGTGFSSLSHIKHLPADTVKIDRAFVAELAHDRDDRMLVKSIIDISEHFGMEAVAEGVETIEQRDILREMNCGLAQGYLWSPPIEGEESLANFLQRWFIGEIPPLTSDPEGLPNFSMEGDERPGELQSATG
jgi:diguanylate cyclase (GGDEF)-like protein